MKKDMTVLMQANPQLRTLAVQMKDPSHRDGWFIYANRRDTGHSDGVVDITTGEEWLHDCKQELLDSIHSVLDDYKSSAGMYLPSLGPFGLNLNEIPARRSAVDFIASW
jgi:hypothetical protein